MNKNNAMQFLCVNLADNLKRNKAPYGHMEPAAYQRQYLLRAFLTRTARQVVSFMLVTTSTMVLLPTPIFALEDEWGLDEPSMVISATRINQSVLSAPNAVTIIDAAMIKASGYTNLADVFRLVPGMNVAHVNGRKYAVSYHGGSWSDTNWMQVLINGRSLFMPTLSVIDWDTIGVQIEDIEKIEVIRGPSASAYGSNSFSAAINIITKPIALDSDWQINSRLGTQGEQRHYAKVTSKLKEADVRVSVNSIESDGFDHQNDFKHISSANFGYENQLNHRNAIKGYLAFSEGDTGSLENTYIPDNNRHRDIEAYSGHVIWEHELKAGNAFQAQIYHNARSETDESFTPTVAELFPGDLSGTVFEDNADERFLVGREIFDSSKTQAELQFNWFSSPAHQTVFQLGLRHDYIKSPVFFTRDLRKQETISFAGINSAIKLSDKIDFNLGLLMELQDNSPLYLSPRASLNFFLTPLQSLRLSYSKANRLPTLLEKHNDIQFITSDGEIFNQVYLQDGRAKPEKVTHFEVGYSGRSRQNHVDWNFSAYHMRYEDIIWFNVVPDPSDPSDNFYLAPRNSGYYTVSGVEGEAIYRLEQYHFYKILFNMSHDDDLHHNAVEPKNVIKSRDKTPSATIGAVGSWQWRSINCGLNAFYVDTINWSNQNDTVDAYFRLDTHLGTQLSLNSQTHLSLRIGAQNINGTYQEFDNDIDIEPRYYISASLEGF